MANRARFKRWHAQILGVFNRCARAVGMSIFRLSCPGPEVRAGRCSRHRSWSERPCHTFHRREDRRAAESIAQKKATCSVQSRGQKSRARALSAKIANRRKHFLHVATAQIVRRFAQIYVGDVNARKCKPTWLNPCRMQAGRCSVICCLIKRLRLAAADASCFRK